MDKKILLSSPTMHGEERRWVEEILFTATTTGENRHGASGSEWRRQYSLCSGATMKSINFEMGTSLQICLRKNGFRGFLQNGYRLLHNELVVV